MQAVFLDYGSLGPEDINPEPLRQLLPGLKLYPSTAENEVAARIAKAQIVLVNKVSLHQQLLAQAEHLKLICLAATGTDNVDLQTAAEQGIVVCNIRDYCTPSVVQHVYGLILELTLGLSSYRQSLGAGDWTRSAHFCLLDQRSHELAGKTLGIVGLGTLGNAVAKLGHAFGMRVVAARRPYVLDDIFEETTSANDIPRVGWGTLLAQSHFISLHCPLTAETTKLIDLNSLEKMREDAVLINTARGKLIDNDALLAALSAGKIAGAGIDVLSEEPPPRDHALVTSSLKNLLVTPHVAWAAQESRQRAVDELATNVAAFINGEFRNRVA